MPLSLESLGFITKKKTWTSGLYESIIGLSNYAIQIGTTALSALIYRETNLGEHTTEIINIYNNPNGTSTPISSTEITEMVEYMDILNAVLIGAAILVPTAAAGAWLLDIINGSDHFEATRQKLLHPKEQSIKDHDPYIARIQLQIDSQSSEFRSLVFRLWPTLGVPISALIGSAILSHNQEVFSQVLAATTFSSIGTLVLGGGSLKTGREIQKYRHTSQLKQHLKYIESYKAQRPEANLWEMAIDGNLPHNPAPDLPLPPAQAVVADNYAPVIMHQGPLFVHDDIEMQAVSARTGPAHFPVRQQNNFAAPPLSMGPIRLHGGPPSVAPIQQQSSRFMYPQSTRGHNGWQTDRTTAAEHYNPVPVVATRK